MRYLLIIIFLLFTATAQADLVSWWKMDGNFNDSVGTNHGTASGGTTTKVGHEQRAAYFDGVDDRVNCGTGASLNMGTGDATVIFWFKCSEAAPTNNRTFIYCGAGGAGTGADGYFIFLRNSTTQMRVAFSDGSADRIVGTFTCPYSFYDGKWHMVAVFFDRDGNMDLTLDNLATTGATSIAAQNGDVTNQLTYSIGETTSTTFNGLIDEVRLYNHLLTAAEVTQLYYLGSKTRLR